MKKTSISLLILVLLLSACGQGSARTVLTPATLMTTQPTSTATLRPTPTGLPTATVPPPAPKSSSAAPTVPLPPGVTPPSLQFIMDGQLMEQNGKIQEILFPIPLKSRVLDALETGSSLFILTETALTQMDLRDGQTLERAAFAPPVLYGALLAASDGSTVVLSLNIQGSPLSQGRVLAFGVDDRSQKELLARPGFFFKPLGVDAQKTLYLAPLGGDPSFVTVERVNLSTGVPSQLDVGSSWDIGALAPGGSLLSLSAVEHPTVAGDPLIHGLRLFDLAQPSTPPAWLDLPVPGSQPLGMLWSADGRSLYLVLQNTQASQPQSSDGLWQHRAATRSFNLVSAVHVPWPHPQTLTAEGDWLVLQPESTLDILAVHLATGAMLTTQRPPGSFLVRAQPRPAEAGGLIDVSRLRVEELIQILYASWPGLPQYDPSSAQYAAFPLALKQLEALGPRAIDASSYVAVAIGFPREDAYLAAQTLLSMGPDIIRLTLPNLIDLLQSGQPEARMNAALLIGTGGEASSCAAGKLGPLLWDPDPQVRYAATFALEELTGEDLLPDHLMTLPAPLLRASIPEDLPEGSLVGQARAWWTEKGSAVNWHPSYGACDP